jgi:hypothetical protein
LVLWQQLNLALHISVGFNFIETARLPMALDRNIIRHDISVAATSLKLHIYLVATPLDTSAYISLQQLCAVIQ